MKKLFPLLFLFVSALFIFSCKDDDNYVDNDTYSAVYDYKGNFSYNTTDGWNYYRSLPITLYNSDVVLIYQQTDSTTDGAPIWTSLPAKYNPLVNNVTQEVYYDYDFSIHDFKIYVRGTFDLSAMASTYLDNQTFRVVIVPGYFGKSANGESLQNMSYEDVIKKFNIDDSHVKTL